MKVCTNLLFVVALSLAFSCTSREVSCTIESDQVVSFKAVQGDDLASKTVLQSGGAIFWSPGDAINLFYGTSVKAKFLADNSTPVAQTTFSGSLEGHTPNGNNYVWAVYPYSDENVFDGSTITLKLPCTQTGVEGTFDNNLFLSMARSNDYSLQFYNVCGGVKISVAVEGIKYVTFQGKNSEVLAGKAKVGFDEAGKPIIREVIDGETEIRLIAPGNGTFEVGKWYYIVSFPVVFSEGFELKFYGEEGYYNSIVVGGEKAIKRSVWGMLSQSKEPGTPEIPQEPEGPEGPEGPVTPEDPESPLSIVVKCPDKLSYGPSLSVEDLSSRISFTINRSNRDDVSLKLRSEVPWIYTSENSMVIAVNGNASLDGREGTVYLDVFYKSALYDTKSIQIKQEAVVYYITSKSNYADFDVYEGLTPSDHTIAFTPYGGVESVTFVTNSDGYLQPLSDYAYPTLITGDGFDENQDFPSVSFDGETMTIAYGSNRSMLHRGCILNYVPLIWVVEDWSDVENTYLPHYVIGPNGNIAHISINVLQSPVVLFAEYSYYFAMPVSGPMDTPGRNIFKPYNEDYSPTTIDRIGIISNVAWEKRKETYPEDEVIYEQFYGPTSAEGDGKHIITRYLGISAGDRLAVYTDEWGYSYQYYRPQQDYPSLLSKYRVSVDLKDGNNPMILDVANLIQVGVPHTVLLDLDISDGTRGTYEINGTTYEYLDVVTCKFKTNCDNVTKAFLNQTQLHCYYFDAGVFPVDIQNDQEVTMSLSFYSHPDDPDDWLLMRSIFWDWETFMVNGAEIRAEEKYDDHWSDLEPRLGAYNSEKASSSMERVSDNNQYSVPKVIPEGAMRRNSLRPIMDNGIIGRFTESTMKGGTIKASDVIKMNRTF